MAWSHLYGTISSGGANALLPVIRDFMLARGWTVAHDGISMAVPFVAMQSTGEDGTKKHGVMFTKINGIEGLNTTGFRHWEPITPFWTPGAGSVSWYSPGGYFTASGAAPSFLDYFSIGDTVYGFNATAGAANAALVYANQGRMKVTGVTATRLTMNTSIYPYPYAWSDADSSYILTKGGPHLNVCSARSALDVGTPIVHCAASIYYYYIFGDKDDIYIITRIGTNYRSFHVGYVETIRPGIICNSTSSVTAGTSTSMDVEDGSKFSVGAVYQIMNDRTGHVFTVTGISGNTISFSGGLTGGIAGIVYASGSSVGMDVFPYCISTAKFDTGNNACKFAGDWSAVSVVDGGKATYTNIGTLGFNRTTRENFGAYIHPDKRMNAYAFYKIYLGYQYDIRGSLRNCYAMYAQLGNSEDVIRIGGPSGDTYKMFNIDSSSDWYVIKE